LRSRLSLAMQGKYLSGGEMSYSAEQYGRILVSAGFSWKVSKSVKS